ncbi:hypothetical protein D3C87_1044340 [compost metagenome]
MLDFKKFLCGALAVVMTTSSAFGAAKLSQDGSYAPTYTDGQYQFTDSESKIPITWEPQKDSAQTQKAIEDFMKSLSEAQAQAKKPGSKLVGAAVHTYKAFPMESLYFFLGMGAVAFSQLVFNNSQNPVGLEQHIEHSLSPMGMAGFAVFMYFNNLTSATLQTISKNPAFMKYVPYLGMTAGFGMQSIFSHVMSDPNIKFCAFKKPVTDKDMMAGVDSKPCAKAIENFEDLRLAPALTSMLLSTYMAGKGQAGAKWLYEHGKRKALKLAGVDVALALAPGKVQVTGLRAVFVQGLGKVAQITAFVAIDAWLNRIVTYAWKNAFDGRDFYDINNGIVERVNYLKSTNWTEYQSERFLPGFLTPSLSEWVSKDRSLEDRLNYFQKRMTDWRMTNLAEVYEAHQNWNTALGQLIGNYKASYDFYLSLIDTIRVSRFDQSTVKPLEIPYPLSGVKAYNLAADRYDGMTTHVKLFENYQRENVALVAKMLLPEALVYQFKENDRLVFSELRELVNALDEKGKKRIETFRKMLTSKDDKVLAKALYNLRMEQNPALRNPDAPFSKVVSALIEILGAPSPQMEPGRGYLLAYQFAPASQQKINGIDFRKGSSIFGTRLITDYYLMQMVCGPDVAAGESVVSDNSDWGYPSQFHPPMIRPAKHQFKNECISGRAFMTPDSIYTYKIEQGGVKYRGFLDYVRQTARASIVGKKDASNFTNWWSFYTTKQIQKAFDEYAVRYDEIVVKMIRGLYYQREKSVSDFIYDSFGLNQKGRNSLNTGPLYNGTIKSMFQEEGMYLAVLEELMNPSRIFDYKLDPAAQYKGEIQTPALQDIHAEMKKLEGLLKKIKIVEIKGRERIESKLSNAELASQVEAVEAAITIVKQALGVDEQVRAALGEIPSLVNPGFVGAEVQTFQQRAAYDASWAVRHAKMKGELANKVLESTGLAASLELNYVQKSAAKVALNSLSKLAAEMANYGNIAHAVSWNKIYDEESGQTTQTKTDENMKKALKNSGAATNPAGR